MRFSCNFPLKPIHWKLLYKLHDCNIVFPSSIIYHREIAVKKSPCLLWYPDIQNNNMLSMYNTNIFSDNILLLLLLLWLLLLLLLFLLLLFIIIIVIMIIIMIISKYTWTLHMFPVPSSPAPPPMVWSPKNPPPPPAATYYVRLPTTCYSLLPIYYLLTITTYYYLLPTTNYYLPHTTPPHRGRGDWTMLTMLLLLGYHDHGWGGWVGGTQNLEHVWYIYIYTQFYT